MWESLTWVTEDRTTSPKRPETKFQHSRCTATDANSGQHFSTQSYLYTRQLPLIPITSMRVSYFGPCARISRSVMWLCLLACTRTDDSTRELGWSLRTTFFYAPKYYDLFRKPHNVGNKQITRLSVTMQPRHSSQLSFLLPIAVVPHKQLVLQCEEHK